MYLKKDIKGLCIENKEIKKRKKLSLFPNNLILCGEYPKESIK